MFHRTIGALSLQHVPPGTNEGLLSNFQVPTVVNCGSSGQNQQVLAKYK